MGDVPILLGSPATVADGLRPYRDLGFRTVIVRLPAPYDRQTIERIAEVDALLADGEPGRSRDARQARLC